MGEEMSKNPASLNALLQNLSQMSKVLENPFIAKAYKFDPEFADFFSKLDGLIKQYHECIIWYDECDNEFSWKAKDTIEELNRIAGDI